MTPQRTPADLAMQLFECKTGSVGLQLFVLGALLSCAEIQICAQQIASDTIDFSTIEIWDDLRSCLKDVFNTCGFLGGCRDNVALEVGCQTNACLCRASTLGEAVGDASNLAISYCSNYDDQSSATSILTSYCSVRGYTSIVAPTTVTSGASTITVTAYKTVREDETTTATVTATAKTTVKAEATATVTVSGGESVSSAAEARPEAQNLGVWIVVCAIAHFAIPILFRTENNWIGVF